jgi:hypothetical protein
VCRRQADLPERFRSSMCPDPCERSGKASPGADVAAALAANRPEDKAKTESGRRKESRCRRGQAPYLHDLHRDVVIACNGWGLAPKVVDARGCAEGGLCRVGQGGSMSQAWARIMRHAALRRMPPEFARLRLFQCCRSSSSRSSQASEHGRLGMGR